MSATTKQGGPATPLGKAYQEVIEAQVREAKAKLEMIEAAARQKKGQAEIATISNLNAIRQRIEARIKDLKATRESNMSRAKTEIQADVAKFKASIEELAAKLKPGAPTR